LHEIRAVYVYFRNDRVFLQCLHNGGVRSRLKRYNFRFIGYNNSLCASCFADLYEYWDNYWVKWVEEISDILYQSVKDQCGR